MHSSPSSQSPPPAPNDAIISTVGDRVRLKMKNLDGVIRFIGPLKDGNGIFYGVELDEAKMGENNGSFGGKSYFKTHKNRGIFIKKRDIAMTITDKNKECASLLKRVTVGDTVYIGDDEGTVRFIGPMAHSKGLWYGIDLSAPHGDNDGTMHNEWYFDCDYKHGVIVRSTAFRINKMILSLDDSVFDSFSDDDIANNHNKKNQSSHNTSKAYNSIYFVLSMLSFSFGAIIAALPTTIFYIIQTQTGIKEAKLASAFLPVSIVGICVGIASGYILDCVTRYHSVMAVFCLCASGAIMYIPYANTYTEILIAFIIIDGASSGLAPALFVGILRAYNINGSWIISLNMFILFLTMAIMPQMINFSIKEKGGDESGYSDAMFMFAGFGVLVVLLFIVVPSPRRSKLIEDLEEIVKEVDYRRSVILSQRQSNILPMRLALHEDVLSSTVLSSIAEDGEENFHYESISRSDTHFWYTVPLRESIKHRSSISMYMAPKIQTRLSIAFSNGYQAQRHFSIVNELSKVISSRDSLKRHQSVLEDLMISRSKIKQYDCRSPKEDEQDKANKQQRIIRWFAVIAIINEFLKCSNRYSYIAYITTFITELWHDLEATHGLDLITTYFAGQLTSQFITIFLLKIIKPETLSIVCSALMVMSSALFIVVTLWIASNDNALYILYWVSFCNGFGSSPLFTTSLAFLCNIQPLTGMLSSLYNSTDAAAGFTVSLIGILIGFAGVKVLMYVQCATSVLVFIIFVINKTLYTHLVNNGHLELDDERQPND